MPRLRSPIPLLTGLVVEQPKSMRVATFYGSIHTSRPRTRRSVTSDMRRHRKTHTYLCGNNNGVRGSFSWPMKCVRMNSDRVIFAPSIGEFKGPRGLFLPPNLAPNKFQDRPSGASRMQENLLVNGAPPRIPLGKLQHSPDSNTGGQGLLPPKIP